MEIRAELPADRAACLALVTAAFQKAAGVEPIETGLIRELFESPAYLPDLSIVAESAGEVVGHVITTRASVGEQPSLGLGPISVAPGHQREGIGSALMRATIELATARGEATIVLLGDPDYYERFGFVRADALGIEPPEDWGRFFMVLPLVDQPVPKGRFEYAEPFRKL
ncbi:MAG: putative acetyltransferase [Nocardioidaceae bacterium]|jgi:predicted N-acetyltransferase YhbS|nr:putative acetyltransferase [Nocardioidaceae bacterium]